MVRHVALGAVVVILVACEDNKPGPTEPVEITTPVYSLSPAAERLHGTSLSGREEVFTPATPGGPTPADSRAVGLAIFKESRTGTSVDFVLVTSKIDNVTQAHIHCGRFGENGPIRMWLFPNAGPSGTAGPNGSGPRAGVLASGRFAPAGVICPAANVGQDMPLLDAMRAGLAYVNVHTNDGVAPTNTGPGDFPGGELRGQLDREHGH